MILGMLNRILALQKQLPFFHTYQPIWSLSLPVSRPSCVPLSALGVLVHKGYVASLSLGDAFDRCQKAYLSDRKAVGHHFNSGFLRELGVRECVGPSFDMSEGAVCAVKKVFRWIEARAANYQKNTAFALFVFPEDQTKPFHAITVICDGLWAWSGPFGFQETLYDDNGVPGKKGYPIRFERRFDAKRLGIKALASFVADDALLGAKTARIQVITFEALDPVGSVKAMPLQQAIACLHRLFE